MPDKMHDKQPPDNGRLRLLIADDKTETRRSTRLMLTLIPNVEVVALAENGQQAIELARKHQPDIALMDVNMPGMDGLEAIAAMRRQQPALVCVVISAEQQRSTFTEAMAVGAQGYITKPFTSDQLLETITRVGKIVRENRQKTAVAAHIQRERDILLRQLAHEYMQAQRLDDRARIIYERLAQDKACDRRILISLAMIYVTQQEWPKLKQLITRLEQPKVA